MHLSMFFLHLGTLYPATRDGYMPGSTNSDLYLVGQIHLHVVLSHVHLSISTSSMYVRSTRLCPSIIPSSSQRPTIYLHTDPG